jgi:BMFP domain-containing protein YqiC|tara:strand:+ start:168 stop:419 length:252 start_codon:yes stop_codon:yes gene_type:complete
MVIGKFTTAVQAAKAIKSMLPESLYEDIKKYVDTQVQSVIGKMNLVSREEYEEQNKQLRQLCEKIETLEQSATKSQRQAKNKT